MQLENLREALGQVIANERREWRRERELIEAQARETIAELRAKIVELDQFVRESVSARLATVRDGVDGKDGAPGKDGADGKDGAAGRDGIDGAPGIDGANGADGVNGKDGVDGKEGTAGRDGVDGAPGADGQNGRDGERGAEGPPGKVAAVKEFSDRVHYEAEIVAHEGVTYQAKRDTAKPPPHEDWICLAAAGRDGRSFEIRGLWSEGAEYKAMDVVALNGASFVARRDSPGVCPGDGWQLLAAQGKRGHPGERVKGDPGRPGAPVSAIAIDGNGMLTLRNGDGSLVTCDLYPLLSKIDR